MVPHELLRARPGEFGDRSFEQAGEILVCLRDESVACDGCQIGHGRRVQQFSGSLANGHYPAALDREKGCLLGQQQPQGQEEPKPSTPEQPAPPSEEPGK